MSAGKPDGKLRASGGQHELVRLVTRLVIAQAVAGAAIGLLFSRRHLPSILITLALVAAVCALAAVVRSGGHAAWLVAITFESAYVVFGLSRFLTSRYLGGTLLGIITLGALLQPSVARDFALPRRAGAQAANGYAAQEGLEDAADGPLGGHAIG